MAIEIERKFLLANDKWRQPVNGVLPVGVLYIQGYLSRDKNRTVRVRVAGTKGFITIKGKTTGISKPEFEYEIPLDDASKMLNLCDGQLIKKFRYLIEHKGTTWEVDEFLGDNDGLIVAEVELKSEDQKFSKPNWLGSEVSSDSRYSNSNLSITPYKKW